MTNEGKMLLLWMRCGYATVDGLELTPKGRGLFPRWVYRAYLRARCRLDPEFRRAVREFLKPRSVKFEYPR